MYWVLLGPDLRASNLAATLDPTIIFNLFVQILIFFNRLKEILDFLQ
jgi:hypothetical protein